MARKVQDSDSEIEGTARVRELMLKLNLEQKVGPPKVANQGEVG